MALPSLLNMPGGGPSARAFAFDHMMAHRTPLGAMAPLTRFSVLPYHLDPQHGGQWVLNHQMAHVDMLQTLPAEQGAKQPGIIPAQNLLTLKKQANQRKWWTFANEKEHIAAMASLPLPGKDWTFPFG